MSKYTVFCQSTEGGTIWIDTVLAASVSDAIAAGQRACAGAWAESPASIHVLGVAEGNVNILFWNDLED